MEFDFQHGKKERDRQLRRALLEAVNNARHSPARGLHGRPLLNVLSSSLPNGIRFEDDGHAMRLLVDLELKGLVALERKPRRIGQTFGPDFVLVRVTDQGGKLCREEIAVDPDVQDMRITEEQ